MFPLLVAFFRPDKKIECKEREREREEGKKCPSFVIQVSGKASVIKHNWLKTLRGGSGLGEVINSSAVFSRQ